MELQPQQQIVKKKETRGTKPKPKEEKRDDQQTKEMKSQQGPIVDERYTHWKSFVPVLYDWLANHNLVWPSLSCRWVPQLEQATYKNRQRLYLSEQTGRTVPNTLVIANCEECCSRRTHFSVQ